jgi:hypothetical protein
MAELQAMTCDVLSLAKLMAGEAEEALELARQGVTHYADSRLEPENACYVMNVAGLAHLRLSDARSARLVLQAGLDMAVRLRLPRAEGFTAFNLTWALVQMGEVEQASEAASRAARAFLEDGGQEVAAARPLHGCLNAIRAGDAEGALAQLDQMTAVTSRNPELHSPSLRELGGIRALIRAAADASVAGSGRANAVA